MLFDNYLREVTPQKRRSKQQHDRRAARMFPGVLRAHPAGFNPEPP
jgi:hypothetical protein